MATTELPRLRAAAYAALAARIRGPVGSDGYLVNLEDNLVTGVDLNAARHDFEAGAGSELKGKMRAPWSSAALALNAFGPWRSDASTLELEHRGYESIEFEKQCPTGLRGTPPHLDLVATRGEVVLGVESKCTELLTTKTAQFKDAYDTLKDRHATSRWYGIIEATRREPDRFRLLDVAQLVKHVLGLTNCYSPKHLKLLYLYWEPLDAEKYGAYSRHRDEIEDLGQMVDGDEVQFLAKSYDDLLTQWSMLDEPSWLGEHVQNLRDRYSVDLAPHLERAQPTSL